MKNKQNAWYKWEVLILLWMAYLLNQADRQVFNTVLPAIRDALQLTDTSIGLIATMATVASRSYEKLTAEIQISSALKAIQAESCS